MDAEKATQRLLTVPDGFKRPIEGQLQDFNAGVVTIACDGQDFTSEGDGPVLV